MPSPLPTLEFALTALPGDYYLRLPVVAHALVPEVIDDTLVMVDGIDPSLYPDLEPLEPEERHEGLCPIEVRTVVVIAKARLMDWLPEAISAPTPEGRDHAASDADIAGVLYWGGESERWRLRRVCIGRYSRFEELDDTSELDSLGAFRDWLLVQNNQFHAWTLFANGWSDFNTTKPERLAPFWLRYARTVEHFLGAAPCQLDLEEWGGEMAQATKDSRWGMRWPLSWDLATGRVTRESGERVKVR